MIHDISAKKLKTFFKWKKIQFQVSKSGVEEKRKKKKENKQKQKEKKKEEKRK